METIKTFGAVLIMLVFYIVIFIVLKRFICKECLHKKECEEAIGKGDIPPCVKDQMQNPYMGDSHTVGL
jgi:hypothetical protein